MAPSVRMKIHLDKSQPNQSINTYHQSYFLKNIKQHLHTHAKTDANKETSKSDSSNSDDSNNNNKGRNKTQETERGEGQAVSSITASMQSLSTSPSSPPSASRLSALSPLTAANTPSDSWIFELSAEKFSVLYNDLKQAQQIMEEIDEQQ